MNKRAVQAIGVAVVTGMLFLQAMVAGGVASEEMGMVMDAMRKLRRADNVQYELVSFTRGEETTQKIWVDLLTENWLEELSVQDDDGMVVFWKRFFSGSEEWMSDGQSGWETVETSSSVPGINIITEFPLGVDDIAETEYLEEEECKKIIFTVCDDVLEEHKQDFLALLEAERQDERMQEISYQQYEDTSYKNASIVYSIDVNGQLREVLFSMDVTQPEILLNAGGKYVLGEKETYQMGYSAKVVSVNDMEVVKKIEKCAAEVNAMQ